MIELGTDKDEAVLDLIDLSSALFTLIEYCFGGFFVQPPNEQDGNLKGLTSAIVANVFFLFLYLCLGELNFKTEMDKENVHVLKLSTIYMNTHMN